MRLDNSDVITCSENASQREKMASSEIYAHFTTELLVSNI